MRIICRRKLWFALSGAVIGLGLLSLVVQGLNLGIDFTGGDLFHLRMGQSCTTADVRAVLQEFGLQGSVVQKLGEKTGRSSGKETGEMIVKTKPLSEETAAQIVSRFGERLGTVELLRKEKVWPIIGRELTRRALLAVSIAAAGILVYVGLRFEFKFAVAAVAALLHDVLVTVGFFSLARLEVTSAFIAAILTVVGYSINDTIVIFDRVRENMRTKRSKESLEEVADRSIHQSLSRSINTVATTLLAIGAVYLLGGTTIRQFALVLIVGITAGTYSSIFIATPLWVMQKGREVRRHAAARAASR